ncbi:MAG TPA: GNAT family N-acetyltransferase [Nitrospirota bacterium]
MKRVAVEIIPMKRRHIRACGDIAAASEPWKTLREGIDFSKYITLKQAYVCERGGKTAGFIIFTPEPVFARGGYVRAVGVAPEVRRQGVGKKLLTFAERIMARRCPNSYLCVSSFNRKAMMFYSACGYIRAGRLPDLIVPGASEYIYWKRLPMTKG